MNFLKRIYQRVFKRNKVSLEPDCITRHLELCFSVVYPEDILEGLCLVLAMLTHKPVHLNASDIKAYNLFDSEDGSFVGSCYAVKKNNRFFGSLLGTDYIFSCPKILFRFEKTDAIKFPLKKENNMEYTLLCKFKKDQTITPLKVNKLDSAKSVDSVLFEFADNTSLKEAFQYCQEMGVLF